MYHETTYQQQHQRRRRLVRLAVVVAVVLVVVWQAVRMANVLTREQGAQAVRESVVRSAVQCCAIEGSYPTSLQYLEEHYGLVVNERDYQVSYEWLGDNIPPSVVVRPL